MVEEENLLGGDASTVWGVNATTDKHKSFTMLTYAAGKFLVGMASLHRSSNSLYTPSNT